MHSRAKLTIEGATLAADRVHELASDLLPAACGGSPVDYQIVEEEDGNGFTRLVVRVHPELARRRGGGCAGRWRACSPPPPAARRRGRLRRAGVVTVRREKPRLTRGGKSLAVERGGLPRP